MHYNILYNPTMEHIINMQIVKFRFNDANILYDQSNKSCLYCNLRKLQCKPII